MGHRKGREGKGRVDKRGAKGREERQRAAWWSGAESKGEEGVELVGRGRS